MKARLVLLVVVVGCGGPPPMPTKFVPGRNRPADIALHVASRDLGCPLEQLQLVSQANRRYVNESAFRYVIEGCGERAGYYETCDLITTEPLPPGWYATNDSPLACRDLLMTRIRIAPEAAPPAPAPAAAPTE